MHDRTTSIESPAPASQMESPYAWLRLGVSVLLSTIGGVGMWSVVVALPAVQREFGVARADAAFPYSLTMIGFMFGGVMMGRLSDRFGVIVPVVAGTLFMSAGYIATAYAPSLGAFAVIYGVAIGMLGSAATFSPLVADSSLWFDRRRGLAVSLCASGNYLAGTFWPPIIEPFITAYGWRPTHIGIGLFCLATMLPLSLVLRRRPPMPLASAAARDGASARPLGLTPNAVQGLLALAGLGCCIAMSMPQVHIVAYCVDLGYGPARGAEMLSLMLGFGVVSRLVFGGILDRIGGLPTLLLGSTLQAVMLAFYLPFDGLVSLYLVSALFGLSQGGIVPSYAVIVRELFPARQAGIRISLAISATLAGMALGSWLSGAIFDWTGSYKAALVHGIGWNLVTMSVAFWMLRRRRRWPEQKAA